jgi:hypothetical protein
MKKNTFILVGLFVLLLAAALFVLHGSGELSADREGSGPMFAIDSAAVDKIELISPEGSVRLERQTGKWFVVLPLRAKASPSAIERAVQQVKILEAKNIVSSNPAKHSLFQVDTTGTEIRLWEGEKIAADFILGKPAQSYGRSYVRRLHSAEVAEAAVLRSVFGRSVRDWRDKTIAEAVRMNIAEVSYQFGDTALRLTLRDSLWFVGTKKAKQAFVEGIVNTLSNFEADDFLDTSMPKSARPAAVCSYAGIQIRFMFDTVLKKYYVQSSRSSQWFVVEPWRADPLLKREKDLLER